MKLPFKLLILIFAVSLFPSVCHAYLDPGAGSMIIQAVLGTMLFIGAGIGVFWKKIKSFFIRNKKEEKN